MEDDWNVAAMATDTFGITEMMASSTCDVIFSTDPPAPLVSVWTQCDDPPTCDRGVNTNDLDDLAEEFMKMKSTRRRKKKRKRRACRAKDVCEHQQRAQRAELNLLSFQLNMCRVYCWRRFYDSAEGERAAAQCRSELPPNVSIVLQKLDSDFAEMKDQILEGVPLEQLSPLTVISDSIITGGGYVPAQILSDLMTCHHRKHFSTSSHQDDVVETLTSSGLILNSFTQAQSQTSRGGASGRKVKIDKVPVKISVCLVPQDKGAAAARDLNLNEAWFDAEEDLGPDEDQGPSEDLGPHEDMDPQEDLGQIQDQASASVTKLKPSRSKSCSSDELSSERVSSATRRTEVSMAPTAMGTCVACHYGTMGSFDALMSQLTCSTHTTDMQSSTP
uniref:RNA-binding protein 44-like isoform X2 n=1 Tax=Scatophagus argus TaxID=75038 RepID=UPI001ED7E481|nr:RNA-binding protein 44-like isoform X2 [Scatophagus argus]